MKHAGAIVAFVAAACALSVQGADARLSWAPPALTSPVVKQLPAKASSLKLDKTKDYILRLPADEPYVGELNIYGGSNVVVVGGTVKIPSEDEGYKGSKRAVYLHGQTGTIHLEGILVTGSGLQEGFNLDERDPNCVVQLQNIRVEWLYGSYSGNHADVIQSWAGPNVLRIDQLTGYSHYQGFFLLPNQHFAVADGGFVPKEWSFRRVNLVGDENDAAYMFWTQGGDTQPAISLDDVWARPRTSNLGQRNQYLWPKNDPVWDDVNEGLPPGGDFVPAAEVGIGYASPGYVTAREDIGIRYVSPDGDDHQCGFDPDSALRSISVALRQLVTRGGGEIRLLPGVHLGDVAVETTTWRDHSDETDADTCFLLTNAIRIVGIAEDPSLVVVRRSALADGSEVAARLFCLDHPGASLASLTVSGGRPQSGNGGNIYIGTSGGTVECCIIENGDATATWGNSGGNVFMRGGRVTCCVIRGGKAKDGTGQWAYGGGVAMGGGVLDNCLIVSNSCARGASIWARGTARVVNCTVVGNVGKRISGVHAEGNAQVVNCAIFGNRSSDDTTGHQHVWHSSSDAFDHCAGEVLANEQCIASQEPGFRDAAAGVYSLLPQSPLFDSGRPVDLLMPVDLAGGRRKSGEAIDVGCFELQRIGFLLNLR